MRLAAPGRGRIRRRGSSTTRSWHFSASSSANPAEPGREQVGRSAGPGVHCQGPLGLTIPKAEKALLESVLDNPIINARSRGIPPQALFELAQPFLPHRLRYEDAISRLEETTERYPADPRMAQLLFLMADSYRKIARALLGGEAGRRRRRSRPADRANPIAAAAGCRRQSRSHRRPARSPDQGRGTCSAGSWRMSRVQPARAGFIDKLHLEAPATFTVPTASTTYVREYEEAIRHYDAATLRYQEEVHRRCRPTCRSSIAYLPPWAALTMPIQPTSAAKWLLRKMPAEAF